MVAEILIFLVLNFCASITVLLFCEKIKWLTPLVNIWRKLSLFISLLIVFISMLTLLFGLIGLLRPSFLLFFLLPLGLFSLFLWRRDKEIRAVSVNLQGQPFHFYVALFCLSLVCGIWVIKLGIYGTYPKIDDLVYHSANLVEWLKNQQIATTAFSYQSYYPFNGELINLWMMLPFNDNGSLGVTRLLYLALYVSSTIGILRGLQVSYAYAFLAPVIALSSFTIYDANWGAVANEWFAGILLLCAIYLSHVSTVDQGFSCWRWLCLGGILGFVAGIKTIFIPYTVAILAITLFSNRRIFLKALSFFILGFLVTGSAWYIKNFYEAGNPVYPAESFLFEGPFSLKDAFETSLWWGLQDEKASSIIKQFMQRAFLDNPFFISMIVIAFISIGRLIKTKELSHEVLCQLSICLCINVILFSFFPFSGYDEALSPHFELRFLYPAFIFSIPLAFHLFNCLLKKREPFFIFLMAFLTIFSLIIYLPFSLRLLTICLGIVLTIIFCKLKNNQWYFKTNHLVVALLSGLFLLSLIPIPSFYMSLRMYKEKKTPFASIFQAVENLPEGSKVASFDGLDTYVLKSSYPLFGTRFQFTYLPVLANGQPAKPLHEVAVKKKEQESFWAYLKRLDNLSFTPEELLNNLQQQGIDFVVTQDKWKTQEEFLESSYAKKIFQVTPYTTWDIRR